MQCRSSSTTTTSSEVALLQRALTEANMGHAEYVPAGRDTAGELSVECRLGSSVISVGRGTDLHAASCAAAQDVLRALASSDRSICSSSDGAAEDD